MPVLLLTGCTVEDYNKSSDYVYDYADCYIGETRKKYEIADWEYYKDGLIEIKTTDGDRYMISMDYCRLINYIDE